MANITNVIPNGFELVPKKVASTSDSSEWEVKGNKFHHHLDMRQAVPKAGLTMSRALVGGMSWFPLPIVLPAKLKYSSRMTLNPGAGTLAAHVFSANGLWDTSPRVGTSLLHFMTTPWLRKHALRFGFRPTRPMLSRVSTFLVLLP